MSLKIWDGLHETCTSHELHLLHNFANDGFKVTALDTNKYYAYKDNGSNILAVAHLDTVRPAWDASIFEFDGNSRIVSSPALDDRLGVFIITKLLPRFGVVPDILLTTDEEIGASTARLFTPGKTYNWIFSFDRRGTDVVMYDYRTSELVEILTEHGFDMGWGSFSDICYLEHLGVAGFNFGTGYYAEHTEECFAILDHTSLMVATFIDFFNKYKDTLFPYDRTRIDWDDDWGDENIWWYDPKRYDPKNDSWGSSDYDDDYDDDHDWDRAGNNSYDALAFEDEHEILGHDVDTYIIDDLRMCIECFTCNKYMIFKG